ncbi:MULTISPECIES: ABC transporter ATP-binding protein [unclassified Niallia]|uniref:ABC transporter ATP-binding protein n=1 Tax=unclassified Niallia TaxID=2837522 RepID=UPI001EDC4ED9|nr:ABC transporter ATP-binding protein [Niallia sp. Man26]UPO89858.1 ABC transporter ATP-binding protein/permease [Niallia sp. Man26]
MNDRKTNMPPQQMGLGGPKHFRGNLPVQRANNMKETLVRIWRYIGHQRKGLVLVVFLTMTTAVLNLLGPYLIGVSIDKYIITRDVNGLVWFCAGLLGVYICSSIATWLQSYFMAAVSQYTVLAMRKDMFARLQKLPLHFFDRQSHGELMSRTTNDMENVSNTLNQSFTTLISSIMTLIGALCFMLSLNIGLTLLSFVTIPIVMFLTSKIAKFTRKYFTSQQQHLGELNGYIEETISGQKAVKVFHREEKVKEEFQDINVKLREASIRAQIYSGFMGPVMNVMKNASFAIIAAAGGWMALEGMVTIGVVVSFLSYSRQFNDPINQVANQFNMLQSAVAGAERVFEIIDTPTEYAKKQPVKVVEDLTGEVIFEDVSFGYKEGHSILKNITLTAKPGDTIALVGPTGAGKTTIVNLLTRFYEISNGRILIDGTELQTISKDSLRRKLGIVLQDAYVFSDSIRENIRYGRLNATDEEVEQAAQLANADGFIRKLPMGYDTVLTAEGGNLSQGQRQLLTIARAILADPAVLILDEATSSIDTRTEMQIQSAMSELMKGRTSFVIAHRLSTIREADKILVLKDGEIIERGTHDELVEQKGFYYDLYTSQFKKVI